MARVLAELGCEVCISDDVARKVLEMPEVRAAIIASVPAAHPPDRHLPATCNNYLPPVNRAPLLVSCLLLTALISAPRKET